MKLPHLLLAFAALLLLGVTALLIDNRNQPAIPNVPALGPVTTEHPDSVALDLSRPKEADEAKRAEPAYALDGQGTAAAPASRHGIHGTVVVEDAAPLGEPAHVLARFADERGAIDADARGRVDNDGAFTIPIPDGAVAAELTLEAEFLGLQAPVRWTTADSVGPVLRAHRGGCVVVELVGSGTHHPEAVPGEAFQIFGAYAPYEGAQKAPTHIGSDGRLRIGGARPRTTRWVGLEADLFVDAWAAVPMVAVGERTVVELSVVRGVSAAGRIVDAEGAGIADAEVHLRSWEHIDMSRATGFNETVVTGEDGEFLVGGVLAGDIRLRAFAPGFRSATEEFGDRGDGEAIRGLTITMERGNAVLGTVTWPDGAPAVGVNVRATAAGQDLKNAHKAETDEQGAFTFTGLSGSRYRVFATESPRGSRTDWHSTAEASPGNPVALVLKEGASIQGRVVDDADQGLAKFLVWAAPVGAAEGGKKYKARVRKGDGDFEIKGMAAGEYDLTVVAKGYAGPLPVRVSVPNDAARPVLVAPRLAKAAGVVVDPTAVPLADFALRVGGKSVTTDAEGRFAAEGVRPGVLVVRLSPPSEGVLRSDPVVVAPGEQREGITLVVGQGASVLGQLHPSLVGGIHREATLRAENVFGWKTATIEEDGTFRFTGIAAGRYWVGLAPSQGGEFADTLKHTLPIPVDVPADTAVSVILGHPDAYPITCSGSVTIGGEPATGRLIYIYAAEGERTFPAAIDRTRDDGTYEFRLDLPGTYNFNIGEGQMGQARFQVEVTDERHQVRDFVLPDRVLRGRATLANGDPAGGRMYVLMRGDAPRYSKQAGDLQFAWTAIDGTFRFRGIHPGPYRLYTGTYLKEHPTDGLLILKNIVVPESGEAKPLDIRIPKGSLVYATAVGPDGRPLAGHRISLEDGEGYPTLTYDTRRTDAQGKLRFAGVGPGRWSGVVRDDSGRERGRAEVHVQPGESVDLHIPCSN